MSSGIRFFVVDVRQRFAIDRQIELPTLQASNRTRGDFQITLGCAILAHENIVRIGDANGAEPLPILGDHHGARITYWSLPGLLDIFHDRAHLRVVSDVRSIFIDAS